MNVLDPFEVAEICVWPLDLGHLNAEDQKEHLDRAEFTVFEKVVAESKLGAVLNEKPPRSIVLQFGLGPGAELLDHLGDAMAGREAVGKRGRLPGPAAPLAF